MNRKWSQSLANKPTLLYDKSLRSGQNIHFDGNVVVLGDVNPGAEIVAGGHILVMGALRGLVTCWCCWGRSRYCLRFML